MEKKRPLSSWHGLLATMLALLFMLYGGKVMKAIFGDKGGMLAGVVLALIGLVFVLLTRTKLSEAFPVQLPPIRQFFASIGITIGVVCLNGVIGIAMAQVIPDYAARETAIDTMVMSMSPFAAILLVALQPAICEEFFCRGFLARAFSDLKSEGIVIFLTSLIFGGLHMDLYAFLPTALLGAAFAFIALRTKSLVLPMFLHFGNNALSVVITYLSAKYDLGDSSSLTELSTPVLILEILFYLGLALFFLWFSFRWFLGKKILTKSSLVVFIVASLLVLVANTAINIMSMDFVAREVAAEEYTERIEHTVPVTLEEGYYSASITASADDPVRIVLLRGDEYVKQTDFSTMPVLSFSGTLEAGEYAIAFYSPEGEALDGGTLTYTITIIRVKNP